MDKEALSKKVAGLLGVSNSERDLAFSILVEKITEILAPDEALRVPDLGYFQIKHKPIKLVEKIITDDLGAETSNTLLFSPIPGWDQQDSDLMFLAFDIPSAKTDNSRLDENVFDIGFGKPILPLSDDVTLNDSNTSFLLLKKSIEERVLELLADCDKLENFDLWEDYLNSINDKTLSQNEETSLLDSLNTDDSSHGNDEVIKNENEPDDIVTDTDENVSLSEDGTFDEKILDDESEMDKLLEILEDEIVANNPDEQNEQDDESSEDLPTETKSFSEDQSEIESGEAENLLSEFKPDSTELESDTEMITGDTSESLDELNLSEDPDLLTEKRTVEEENEDADNSIYDEEKSDGTTDDVPEELSSEPEINDLDELLREYSDDVVDKGEVENLFINEQDDTSQEIDHVEEPFIANLESDSDESDINFPLVDETKIEPEAEVNDFDLILNEQNSESSTIDENLIVENFDDESKDEVIEDSQIDDFYIELGPDDEDELQLDTKTDSDKDELQEKDENLPAEEITSSSQDEFKTVMENDIDNDDSFIPDFNIDEEDTDSDDFFDGIKPEPDENDDFVFSTEEEKITTNSEDDMSDEKNSDIEWDFEELKDDEEDKPEISEEIEDDSDIFRRLEKTLTDEENLSEDPISSDAGGNTSDEAEIYSEDSDQDESHTEADASGITLDLSNDETKSATTGSSSSTSSYMSHRAGNGKRVWIVVAASIVFIFIIVYFFAGSGSGNSGTQDNLLALADSNQQQDTGEVVTMAQTEAENIQEPTEVVEQPTQTAVKPETRQGSLLKEFPNERLVSNLIFFNGTDYYVQVSSHSTLEKAEKEARRLIGLGHNAFIMKAWIDKFNAYWYRVKIGFFKSVNEARTFQRNNKF